MPRPRINRPQNMGQNRNVQMRNNARRGGPSFSPNKFQGGLGQGPSVAPGVQSPGVQPPTAPQPGAGQCPAGQQLGKGPGGRIGCVPVRGPGMPGQGPSKGPGAGVPTGIPGKPNREGY